MSIMTSGCFPKRESCHSNDQRSKRQDAGCCGGQFNSSGWTKNGYESMLNVTENPHRLRIWYPVDDSARFRVRSQTLRPPTFRLPIESKVPIATTDNKRINNQKKSNTKSGESCLEKERNRKKTSSRTMTAHVTPDLASRGGRQSCAIKTHTDKTNEKELVQKSGVSKQGNDIAPNKGNPTKRRSSLSQKRPSESDSSQVSQISQNGANKDNENVKHVQIVRQTPNREFIDKRLVTIGVVFKEPIIKFAANFMAPDECNDIIKSLSKIIPTLTNGEEHEIPINILSILGIIIGRIDQMNLTTSAVPPVLAVQRIDPSTKLQVKNDGSKFAHSALIFLSNTACHVDFPVAAKRVNCIQGLALTWRSRNESETHYDTQANYEIFNMGNNELICLKFGYPGTEHFNSYIPSMNAAEFMQTASQRDNITPSNNYVTQTNQATQSNPHGRTSQRAPSCATTDRSTTQHSDKRSSRRSSHHNSDARSLNRNSDEGQNFSNISVRTSSVNPDSFQNNQNTGQNIANTNTKYYHPILERTLKSMAHMHTDKGIPVDYAERLQQDAYKHLFYQNGWNTQTQVAYPNQRYATSAQNFGNMTNNVRNGSLARSQSLMNSVKNLTRQPTASTYFSTKNLAQINS